MFSLEMHFISLGGKIDSFFACSQPRTKYYYFFFICLSECLCECCECLYDANFISNILNIQRLLCDVNADIIKEKILMFVPIVFFFFFLVKHCNGHSISSAQQLNIMCIIMNRHAYRIERKKKVFESSILYGLFSRLFRKIYCLPLSLSSVAYGCFFYFMRKIPYSYSCSNNGQLQSNL